MSGILLFGASGQVGWELHRALLPLGEVHVPPRHEADFAQPFALGRMVHAIEPEIIINAAAYTAVDPAETEREIAFCVNAEAPAALAAAARDTGALLVHYSSDYVFDGSKAGPYTEADAPEPLSAYGHSKLAGDQAIESSGADYLIFRTSWVYSARGKNFVKTIIRLAAEREELRVVSDQVGAPTWARLIADTTAQALAQVRSEQARGSFRSGLYNLASGGNTSWYGFALAIVERMQRDPTWSESLKTERVVPIPAVDYPLPAKRPANSRLDCTALTQRFGLIMPDWEVCLDLCLAELA